MMKANLKTWPATPVLSLARYQEFSARLELVGIASFNRGAAGVGQPFKALPIANLKIGLIEINSERQF